MVKTIDELREEQIVGDVKHSLAIVSDYMAIPMFLIFWSVDVLFYPQFKWEFLGLRLLIIPVCLFFKFILRYTNSHYASQIAISAYTIAVASILNFMNYLIADPTSGYYAGLNLIAIVGLSFIPLSTKFFMFTTAGIYLPYYLVNIFFSNTHDKINYLIQNTFFIVSSVVICFLIRTFNERLRRKEIRSQVELSNEVLSRDKIIAEKSSEAVTLHALSAQFSPQVVRAIKDGKINLNESVHRSKICAIFIDIVNSTERVVNLDQQNVQVVLARFLDTTLTIFLKYDLTIDKFHGDGVLAFSNDPVKRDDFVERVCLAALEVRAAIDQDREYYINYWQNEMQVRIGIAVGYANVGFYGDKKSFRSFTAIGQPLPFASRLTSIAEPNQILVDSEIAHLLLSQNYSLKDIGERKLKGFENTRNIIFSLEAAPVTTSAFVGSQTCPSHPNTVLHLDTNEKGQFTLRCRECGL